MNITNIEELKKIGEGEIVELSPFANSESSKLVVRLKRPDITMMIIDGKIPDPLIETAMNLTKDKNEIKKDIQDESEKIDIEKTKKYFQAIRLIAKHCLIAPTYEEIEEFAGGFTINQLIEIFNYVIGGVEALKSFRNG